jgi:hypothetical protein
MKVQFGVGNSITTAFTAAAKTVAVSNLTNADITPQNIEIFNTTRSAWMIGGDSTAVATVAITSVAGKPVFTLTLRLMVIHWFLSQKYLMVRQSTMQKHK